MEGDEVCSCHVNPAVKIQQGQTQVCQFTGEIDFKIVVLHSDECWAGWCFRVVRLSIVISAMDVVVLPRCILLKVF